MKSKITKLITAAAALLSVTAVMLVVLTACGNSGDNAEKSVTLYIGETPLSATTHASDMLGFLNEMKDGGKISGFEYTSSSLGGQYDAFVTSIGDLKPKDNEYLAVFHTIDDITLKAPLWPATDIETVEMFGKPFWYSGVGVKLLPVKNGASYCFKMLEY